MKLVSYSQDRQPIRAGILLAGHVVDAERCAQHAGLHADAGWQSVKSILTLVTHDDLAALNATGSELLEKAGVPLSGIRLGPPVPDPGKLLCIGLNYQDHVAEAQQDDPDYGTQPDPVVFATLGSALCGDGDDIVLPEMAPSMVDWEGELGVVIGRQCRRVAKADALDYVAGYMIYNDISARDVQTASPQWTLGKSFDTFSPCGPALVTRDEVPDPQALELTTEVNGEVMQSTNTRLMINPVDRLIEFISAVTTLLPGDIIATGTCAGVGYARDPKVFLRDEDSVTVTISRLGRLTNPVRAEKRGI